MFENNTPDFIAVFNLTNCERSVRYTKIHLITLCGKTFNFISFSARRCGCIVLNAEEKSKYIIRDETLDLVFSKWEYNVSSKKSIASSVLLPLE